MSEICLNVVSIYIMIEENNEAEKILDVALSQCGEMNLNETTGKLLLMKASL